jgi:cytochrome P450
MPQRTTPPGPKAHLLVGHLPEFIRNPLDFLTRSAWEYGDLVTLQLPVGRTYLVTNPEEIEFVLTTTNRNFVRGRLFDPIRPLLGNGLFTSEGEFWLRQRRLMQPAFHRERIKSYSELMVGFTEQMLESWQTGEIRDINFEMQELTLRIASRLLFNAEISHQDASHTTEALTTALKAFQAHFASPLKLPEYLPTPGNVRFQGAIRQLDQIIRRIIAERRASRQNGDDLFGMLLEARDEQGQPMSDNQLRDELLTLFVAGHETTAVTLSWAWYLISQHPAVEEQLLAELAKVLNGRNPTIEDLRELSYLDQVIKEVMRLYPVAWFINRQASKELELSGYKIEVGQQLWISPWVLHRDPRYYSEPLQFKPERWESDQVKKLPKYAYLPFGGGPRICIGNTFAQAEIALVLATVLQKFRLELVPGKPVVPNPLGTVRPKYPVQMQLSRRNISSGLLQTAGLAGS